MCQVLAVSRSGYYKWLTSGPSKRSVFNRQLLVDIRQIHEQSKQTYGSPRITAALKDFDIIVSRPRVARLMQKAGIRSKLRRKYVITTDSRHKFPVSENLLDRNFKVGTIGKAWVSDITYIKTEQRWLYLTTVIDLGDRKVIGWSFGDSLKAEDTSMAALTMAVKSRPVTSKLIFHSDRGVQYACEQFRDLLKTHPTVQQSMSRKGNCWDNAVAESFFKTLKAEWTNWFHYKTTEQAALSVFEYIEGWYNTRRKHSALNFKTPAEYEQYLLTKKLAA